MTDCPLCHQKQLSRVDNCMVELFGHCWMCGRGKVDAKEITLEQFRERENAAIKKKYEE